MSLAHYGGFYDVHVHVSLPFEIYGFNCFVQETERKMRNDHAENYKHIYIYVKQFVFTLSSVNNQ